MEEDGDTFILNPILFHFITDNFVRSLCLDLRRLTENGPIQQSEYSAYDISVFSLASVLRDLIAYREQYTRRRLFLGCELEYDVAAIRARHDAFMLRQPSGTVFSISKELDPHPSEYTHSEWDRLCGCAPENRSADDVLTSDYLALLQEEVTTIRKRVEAIVNKRFAHAATPRSRESIREAKPVSLSELVVDC